CLRLLAHLALCLRRPIDLRCHYGSWAVVTGPTTGLGRSMATELARRGISLVLLDLDAANLQSVSAALHEAHPGVETKTVVFDLSLVGTAAGDEAMRRLKEATEGLDVGLLVNNAAVNRPGALYVHEADVERLARMVLVNVMALTEVTAAVLPGMLDRGRGAIVNVGSGSTVAVPSFPLYTVYSATKRYVQHLTRCLSVEYKHRGIDIKATMTFPAFVATADAYARDAARWIGHGMLCVPDASQQLQWFLAGFVPDAVHDWYLLRQHLKHRAILRPKLA
uniref:Uncharacterized protein n=1 Tax=Aegilops tauschii subsp. strangulata TaxID=200361 RepID=A0A453D3B4_AEGTS